jgi:hypothetical protein
MTATRKSVMGKSAQVDTTAAKSPDQAISHRSQIGAADTDGVLFIGICATPEDIRSVERGESARTI